MIRKQSETGREDNGGLLSQIKFGLDAIGIDISAPGINYSFTCGCLSRCSMKNYSSFSILIINISVSLEP